MQSQETEIILHRKKLYPSRWSIFWLVILLFLVMGFGGDIAAVKSLANIGWKPTTSEWSRLVFDSCQITLVFLLIILPFLHIIRRPFAPSIYRISHEGIFFPFPVNWLSIEGVCYPILIEWHEIKALYPYTLYPGAIESTPVLGIVLRDYEAMLARSLKEHAPGRLRCFFIYVTTNRLTHPPYLAPVNLPQFLLPISLNELVGEIRTHFAAELEEHGISVLEWQSR